MNTLNDHIQEYTAQLHKGQIQKAYKGIMDFMSNLRTYLMRKYPEYTSGALYSGYMDMTYFAFTPPALRSAKLKIAIVFLHEECRFELWLAANNRQIQAGCIELLRHKNIGSYELSKVSPGVDSVIESPIVQKPDFGDFEKLIKQIETKTIEFARDIDSFLL